MAQLMLKRLPDFLNTQLKVILNQVFKTEKRNGTSQYDSKNETPTNTNSYYKFMIFLRDNIQNTIRLRDKND